MEYILGGRILTTFSVLSPSPLQIPTCSFPSSFLPNFLSAACPQKVSRLPLALGRWWGSGCVLPSIIYVQPGQYDSILYSACRRLVVTMPSGLCKQAPTCSPSAVAPSSFPSSVNSLTWSWSVLLESFQELRGGRLRAVIQGREGSGQIVGRSHGWFDSWRWIWTSGRLHIPQIRRTPVTC